MLVHLNLKLANLSLALAHLSLVLALLGLVLALLGSGHGGILSVRPLEVQLAQIKAQKVHLQANIGIFEPQVIL